MITSGRYSNGAARRGKPRRELTMRRIFLLLLVTNILVLQTTAQSVTGESGSTLAEANKNQVLEVEAEVDKALLAGDTNVLGRIYADDLSYTNQIGEILTKGQVLAGLQTGTIKLPTLGRQDIRLHAFGNTVILTGISTSTLRYKGVVSDRPRRFANVYVKQNGQWKLVAHTVTEIAK
jgi:ketosteroid isomerase-like protein